MKVMYRIFRAVTATAMLFGLVALSQPATADDAGASWAKVQKAGVLRCGAAVFPPFVMRDPVTGEYSGFFADLCREFAKEVLQVRAEFIDTTWDNIVAGLQAGKWDLSLALNHTPQRALAVAFSKAAVPYEISLAYNKENPKVPKGVKSFADIDTKGVTIIVVSGTAMDKSVTGLAKNAQILRLPSSDEARLALMSRRGDLLADPSDSNRLFIDANKDWAVDFVPTPAISKQGMGFGVHKSMTLTDLQALDIFITEKQDTGHIDALVDKAFAQIRAEAK